MYNEIIVVEGKNDKSRILAIFSNANVITTNGSEISESTLRMLEQLSKKHKIVLFLDPDKPGEKIRSIIANRIPNCSQAFIEKKKAIDEKKHKVGVEHASDEDIIYALNNQLTVSDKKGSLTMSDMIKLGLIGASDSHLKREYIANIFNIGEPNGKTFVKRINMLNISYEKLEVLINEKNWNN